MCVCPWLLAGHVCWHNFAQEHGCCLTSLAPKRFVLTMCDFSSLFFMYSWLLELSLLFFDRMLGNCPGIRDILSRLVKIRC